ncbi:MAG: hypothetical protein AAF543_06255 [Pseudomonadota bacterium]
MANTNVQRTFAAATPEEVMVRVLGMTGFALGLLLTISALVM